SARRVAARDALLQAGLRAALHEWRQEGIGGPVGTEGHQPCAAAHDAAAGIRGGLRVVRVELSPDLDGTVAVGELRTAGNHPLARVAEEECGARVRRALPAERLRSEGRGDKRDNEHRDRATRTV